MTMRVRTLVALAHAAIAAGLATKEQITETLEYERARSRLQIDNRRFLRRGIGKEEFESRNHHVVLAELYKDVQTINKALLRI